MQVHNGDGVLKIIFSTMDRRVYSYIYAYLLVRWIYCSENDEFWMRTLDQRMYTNTLLDSVNASSRILCASLCHVTPGCQDFIFYLTSCKVYGVSDSEQPFPNMGLFEKDSANFTVAELPSGDTFMYALIRNMANTPEEAQSECNKLNSRLVHVNTVEKRELIVAVITVRNEEYNYWLDGYREFPAFLIDDWKFSNGEKFPAEAWSDGFPNDHNSQCVHVWASGGYVIDDVSCDSVSQRYICEK